MEIREVLAANLRRARNVAGLSQEELAHRAGVDRTYISALERCRYAAGVEVLDRIARELGIEAADLLRRPDGDGNAQKPVSGADTADLEDKADDEATGQG
jgi:transcriptional regulator with XRE-family HTH domain